jgi:FdhD protein
MNSLPHEETLTCTIETLNSSDERVVRDDIVAIEAPLELRVEGRPGTILMRTPGHDESLIRGFLFTEGIIDRAEDILEMTRPDDLPPEQAGNVITVRLAKKQRLSRLDRSNISSASCGACGKTSFDALEIRTSPLTSGLQVRRNVILTLPDRLKPVQETFRSTGGVHASGLFSPEGELIAFREDVGRHNALDKLIGWALTNHRIPLDDHILLLSGRISFELVQKATMASIPVIAAVGAPSSLAIDIARQFNMTLAGFLRPHSMNVYTHPHRIL